MTSTSDAPSRLAADARNVEEAIMAGYPAGLVLDSVINDDADDLELRVAFDFDGVVADDAAEQVFQAKGIEAFHRSENRTGGYAPRGGTAAGTARQDRPAPGTGEGPGRIRARLRTQAQGRHHHEPERAVAQACRHVPSANGA